mgnify:FL=1
MINMQAKIHEKIDDLDLFQRRIEIIVGAKLREEDRIADSVKIQDAIRSKAKSWNGSREIRKWREKRV